MTSKLALQEINNSLEKQDTNANANFNVYDKEDALNKGLDLWLRKQVQGINILKEGQEESTMKVDDLQVLLVPSKKMSVSDKGLFVETSKLPEDYRYYNKLTPTVSKGDCQRTQMISSFVENGNVDELLQDWSSMPSFEFEQTFHTLASNRFRVYHNKDFVIDEVVLSYYRNPKKISCDKRDLDKVWEWKDDVALVIIDEAIKLLAGNIESQNAYQLASKRTDESS